MWSSRCSSEWRVFLELPGTLFSDNPQELPLAREHNLIPYHRPRTFVFSSSFSYSPMKCIAKNTLPEGSCRKSFTREPALQAELWKSQTSFILSGNSIFTCCIHPKPSQRFQPGPLNQEFSSIPLRGRGPTILLQESPKSIGKHRYLHQLFINANYIN